MKLFDRKRKNEVIGKGSDTIITLDKVFEALNCTPVSYAYTNVYSSFIMGAEKYFQKTLESATVDDLNCNMFDSYIDAMSDLMKASALEQFTYHMQTINHHKGLVEGELKKATEHLKNLTDDLSEIEREINKYHKLKETLDIH